MKLSWGTWIAIAYSIFAGAMIFALVKSFSVDHSLVVEDYYAHDLAYQTQFDKEKNSLALQENLKISLLENERSVLIQYPADMKNVAGKILFYNPSDKKSDFSKDVQPGENNSQIIPLEKAKPGRWKVQVDWQADGKPFFKETEIYLNPAVR